jgi:hypothetical protein
MIIYNVTVNVEDAAHDAWLEWMKSTHIPDVVSTGCFMHGKIFRILVEEQLGVSYSVQYSANSMEDVDRYLETFAQKLRQDAHDKFGGKFTAFRTLLEHIE